MKVLHLVKTGKTSWIFTVSRSRQNWEIYLPLQENKLSNPVTSVKAGSLFKFVKKIMRSYIYYVQT